MATLKRFSFSLLISTLVFSGFAVVAFSGLFPWVEAQFYSPRVVADLQARLEGASVGWERWKTTSLENLDKVLADRAFEGVFGPTSSREALQGRHQTGKLYLLGVRGGGTLRILSADRTQIHFSTEDTDVKARSDFGLTYRPWVEVGGPDLAAPILGNGQVHVLDDPAGRSVYLLRPWKDRSGMGGYALVSLSLEDWRLFLQDIGVGVGELPVVGLGNQSFVLSLLGRTADPALIERVRGLSAQGILPPVQRVGRAEEVEVALVQQGRFSLLIPASMLELPPVLKGLLLVSLYTLVFLVTYLLANLRGEPLSVVSRKVKRFQLQVVRQYLDLKEQDRIQSLRDELALHSAEIRADVRRSLGRVSRKDQAWVDRYIDTSWQEVLDMIRGPSPPQVDTDWKRLETLLQQALTQGRFVSEAPGPAASRASVTPVTTTRPAKVTKPAPVAPRAAQAPGADLEELEAEDVEELAGDDVDPVEDLDEVEDLEDVEELEEVEDVDELEEVEELEEVDELGEPEEVEELDGEEVLEPADLEELEAGPESVDQSADLEEVEDLDDSEQDAGLRGPSSTPSADDRDPDADLEELDAADDVVEELVPLDEGVHLFHHRPGDRSDALGRVEPVSLEELESLEEDEVLEELPEDPSPEPQGSQTTYPLDDLESLWIDVLPVTPALDRDETALEPDPFDDLVPQRPVRDWSWRSGGFDWDRFALGADEVNLFRGLSDLVTELDAFMATILTLEGDHWKGLTSVGFSDVGKGYLDFGPESPLVRGFLVTRALHVIEGAEANPVLRASFHEKDGKFLRTVACVPLHFRGQEAWLILGLRRDVGDVLHLLRPRRVT